MWWVSFKRADGTWGDRSTGVKVDAVGSRRKVNVIVQDLQAKEQRLEVEGADARFADWVADWMEYHYSNEKTFLRYRAAWAHLWEFLQRRRVAGPGEVNYALCHDYIRWRTDAALAGAEKRKVAQWNTAVVELKCFGAILQEAVRRGYIVANPCVNLRLGRKKTKGKREITREEQGVIEARMLEGREWMRDCWLLAMKHGCRLSETRVPLDRVDVQKVFDEDAGKEVVRAVVTFHCKGGKVHSVPLHRDCLPLVEKAGARESGLLVELPEKNASKLWSQWLGKIEGLEGVTFHCTRVTVITRLARAGYSEAKTMRYIGHASAEVHAIYRKLRGEDVRELGDAL